jgi:glycosyltransferase involved in cell wall biosynthesis
MPAGRAPVDTSVHLVPPTVGRQATPPSESGDGWFSRVTSGLRRFGHGLALVGRLATAQGVHLIVVDRPDGLTAAAAWIGRALRGWPVIACVEGGAKSDERAGFWSRVRRSAAGWFRSRLCRSAGAVLVPDGGVAHDVLSLGVPGYRVLRVPEGLNLADWPVGRHRFDYRRLFDSTDRWVIGTALTKDDPNCGFVLDAADLLQQRSPNAIVWIIAEGELRLELERDARRRGLRNARFAAHVPAGSLPDMLASCDAWLHPVPRANCGLLLPAMAMNVPVVVPNGMPDVDRIIDADAGLPMIPEDPESLVDCVLELREHPAGCRQGRAFVAAHHDAEALTARTLEILLQSALPAALPLPAAAVDAASEPDRTWKDAA